MKRYILEQDLIRILGPFLNKRIFIDYCDKTFEGVLRYNMVGGGGGGCYSAYYVLEGAEGFPKICLNNVGRYPHSQSLSELSNVRPYKTIEARGSKEKKSKNINMAQKQIFDCCGNSACENRYNDTIENVEVYNKIPKTGSLAISEFTQILNPSLHNYCKIYFKGKNEEQYTENWRSIEDRLYNNYSKQLNELESKLDEVMHAYDNLPWWKKIFFTASARKLEDDMIALDAQIKYIQRRIKQELAQDLKNELMKFCKEHDFVIIQQLSNTVLGESIVEKIVWHKKEKRGLKK